MKANTPDNIDELYDSLPENERLIAGILRELILESLPVCYVWPASITWGGKQQGRGVTLGFNQARKLDHGGYLEFGNRKSIGSHVFLTPEEIDVEILQKLLREAWALDQG